MGVGKGKALFCFSARAKARANRGHMRTAHMHAAPSIMSFGSCGPLANLVEYPWHSPSDSRTFRRKGPARLQNDVTRTSEKH